MQLAYCLNIPSYSLSFKNELINLVPILPRVSYPFIRVSLLLSFGKWNCALFGKKKQRLISTMLSTSSFERKYISDFVPRSWHRKSCLTLAPTWGRAGRDSRNHDDVCYLCLLNNKGINSSSRYKLTHPEIHQRHLYYNLMK